MNTRAERWRQVSELFDRVADLNPAQREALLAAQCAHDPALRAEVERLLAADQLTNPLDHDIAGKASALLLEGDPEQHYGQLFGPYRIERLLGQGGMGRVYLAQREGDDFTQTVALKVVGGVGSFNAELARQRFVEERRLLARLEHPNIARLLDGGVGPEAQPWFAMEYVDGAPLTEYCDTHQLSVIARLTLFAKICDAVDYAHRFLIVHRDLKPGNLLVDAHGEPKVLDFGIAKLLNEEGPAEASTVLMTPDYAAPEQIRGGQISTATDVYALGAVLFEVLTGKRPFKDALASREPPIASKVFTDHRQTQTQRATACATTPQALRKALRGDIDRIVRTALDPEPARRYGSAAALAQDLRAVVAGQPISLRSDRAYRTGLFLRRHRWSVAAASLAALGLIATTGWALWQTQQAKHQTTVAQEEAMASQSVSELLVSAFDAADPTMRQSVAEPTAKDVLDISTANVGTQLSKTPLLLARMQMVLGRAYANLGYPDKAAELLNAAVERFLTEEVARPQQAAEAMSLLAQVETDLKHSDRAIAVARRGLQLRRAMHASPEDLADATNTLGLTLIATPRYAEAERVLRAVLALNKHVYGNPSFEVANSMNNLAQLFSNAGKLREAEPLFRESLAMNARIKSNPGRLFGSRSLLAVALGRAGRFDEAEKLLLQNVKLAHAFYPNDSVRNATLQKRLADIHHARGDLSSAQLQYERAIVGSKPGNGAKGSADEAVLLIELADVIENRGDIEGAQRNYALADNMQAALPNIVDGTRLRIIASRGVFLAKHGIDGPSRDKTDGVLAHWISLYAISNRHLPWNLADARFLQAEYFMATGRLNEVESALPAYDPDPEQPLQQIRRHQVLGRLHALRGERDQAIAEFGQAVRSMDALAGTSSAYVALWRLDYTELLADNRMAENARSQIDLAGPVLRRQMVPTSPSLIRLQNLEARLGKPH